MARLGFLDTEGNIFHINENPDNSVLRKKKKKDEDYAIANAGQTVKPTDTVKDVRTVDTVNKKKEEEEDSKLKLQDNTKDRLSYKNKLEEKKAKEKEESSSDSLKLYGKAAKTGLVSGITGIPNAELQEMEGSLKKGKEIKNAGDVVKQVLKTVSDVSNFGKISPQEAIGTAINFASGAKKTIEDKDKDAVSKALGIGTSAVSKATDMTGASGKKMADAVFPLVGAADKNADKKVRQLRETINKPAQEMQEDFAKELQNYGGVEQNIAQGINVAANMAPSLATAAITKNPKLSMAVMANNVKGQATEDALKQGKSLEEAREIGNTKAAAEVATELATGGLNIFGKGALDDVAEQTLNKVIKNPTANYAANKVLGIVGENLEESASNILDKAIDKGTIDPNAKLTMNDITEPWGPTTVSSLLLNAAGGGYTPKAYREYTAQRKADNLTKVQNLNEVERETLTAITQKRLNGEQLDDNDIAAINVINNKPIDVNTQAQNTVQQIQTAVDNGDMTVEEANTQMQNINNQLQQVQNIPQQDVDNNLQSVENSQQETHKIDENQELKSRQNKIIQEANPMTDDVHTGIRNENDIKTFDEAFFQNGEWSGLTPDFTPEMANEAKNSGKVTVYSSTPIEQGAFVTPSKMEAENYAGGNQVYSKEVDLKDVAWIDGAEGQYAKAVTSKDVIKNAYKQIENNNIKATIAPYYNTPLTKQNYGKIRNAVETSFNDTANNIATLMGDKIKDISNNIGGFTFEEGENAGKWVKELSYTYDLENASKEDAMLFSSLMGDLGHEQQEAVISASYADINDSNALEFRFNYKNRDKLSKVLDELGIHDYTIDTNNKTLKLLEFDDLNNPEATASKIADIVEKMGGDLSDAEYTGIQSEYITKGTREGIYKTWLESNERNQENRELYSLVEQAYEKVKGSAENEGTSDSSFSDEELAEEKAKEQVLVAKNTNGQEIKLKQDKSNPAVYNQEAINRDIKDINNQFKNKTVTTKDGTAVSNFYSNITDKSKFIDTDIRNMFKNENDLKFYQTVTNEESLNKANKEIGNTVKSQEKAFDDFISKKDQFDSIDMAKGWILLERFNQAADYDRAYLVAKQMKEMGTKSGQAIQMLNLQSRLTPEGMYKWAVGELMEAENKFNSEKGRTKKEIEKYRDSFRLTPEETDFIKTQMDKVQGMENGRQKDIEIAKINSMLQDKLPHRKGQSLKAWMRISMLFNPKTQVRNVMGNAGVLPVNTLVDAISSIPDRLVAKATGVRTIGGPSIGGGIAYGKGFTKNVKEAWEDYRLGIDTKNIEQNKFEISQGKPFNEKHRGPLKGVRNEVAKKLNAINDFLGFVMDAGDRGFYGGSVENSLYNQQKLNNSTEITNEMREIAENEGMQRTWSDNNEYTKAVLDLRRSINKIGDMMHIHVGEYGLGDLLIPFAKTPANLTKAIVDYSPVGFVNAMTEGKNLKNAIETENYTPQMQHDFAQTIGKATAGTILYALGAMLAQANVTSGNSDEDKDLKNFMRNNLGIQPYSIKIGDKTFTYDWAQPIAAPFAITADIKKGIQENMTPSQALQHFLTTGFNVLSEQSFLSGINEVLTNNDGILNGIEQQIINIPSTAMPTLLKQVTDMFDSTKRQTYSKEGQIKNMERTAMSKDPRGSKNLAPQVDVLGNEIKKYGGENNAFNVFFNPANTEKGKRTPVAEEIYSLYEATQDKSVIPRKVDYSTKIKGENKILTTDEMAKWQKASGKLVTQEVEKAMNNGDYKNMNEDQKTDVIKKIVNYSYQKAKSETFDTPLAKTYNGVENARNRGMGIADYFISTVLKSSR